MIRKINFLLATSLMLFAGCSSAPKSNEVSAAFVSTAQYEKMSCDQLIAEANAVRRIIPSLEKNVDSHRSQQTGVEVVTWILFWPAAFLLDKGEGQSSELARAKGEYQAIDLALRSKRCGS
jgi:hypothetical protein